MLNADIKQSIDQSVLCWLATVDPDGSPNCSPKEIFSHFGDTHVAIANIASPESVKNIIANPAVCLSFAHVFKQKGFKLKGKASYIPASSTTHREELEMLQVLAGAQFPVKGVILVEVLSAKKIIAPGYYMLPDSTEADQIKTPSKSLDFAHSRDATRPQLTALQTHSRQIKAIVM